MKLNLLFGLVLILMLSVGNAMNLTLQDPPDPDAAPFCDMHTEVAGSVCMCANMDPDSGGVLCELDAPRPRFCKWQCGHAKNCFCCGRPKR